MKYAANNFLIEAILNGILLEFIQRNSLLLDKYVAKVFLKALNCPQAYDKNELNKNIRMSACTHDYKKHKRNWRQCYEIHNKILLKLFKTPKVFKSFLSLVELWFFFYKVY